MKKKNIKKHLNTSKTDNKTKLQVSRCKQCEAPLKFIYIWSYHCKEIQQVIDNYIFKWYVCTHNVMPFKDPPFFFKLAE